VNRPLKGSLEGVLDGPLDTILHRGHLSASGDHLSNGFPVNGPVNRPLEGPLEGLLLAELIEPANLLHRLDLPPTTLTHLLELQYHALLFPSPELLSLLPVQ